MSHTSAADKVANYCFTGKVNKIIFKHCHVHNLSMTRGQDSWYAESRIRTRCQTSCQTNLEVELASNVLVLSDPYTFSTGTNSALFVVTFE